MDTKMDKDADSMVVKNVEYAASEYSASSEPPPVSFDLSPASDRANYFRLIKWKTLRKCNEISLTFEVRSTDELNLKQ